MNALESLPFVRSEIFLVGAFLLILCLDFFVKNKIWIGWLSFILLFVAFIIGPDFYPDEKLFFGYYVWDPFTLLFKAVAYLTVGLTILASLTYRHIPEKARGEYFALLLIITLLLTVMGGVTNLLMIFLIIESVSLISYILVGFQKFDKESSEASLKYLLFGSVSSAIMLFGMSLLFGATGTIELGKIGAVIAQIQGAEFSRIALVGMILVLAGIGFKISMVPFHLWAPDVYQGAPTPIAGFLTVAPKALGFAVLIRVLVLAFPALTGHWLKLLVVLSILTMTAGNLIAISQSNVKRLLAYSSVAQAGYILVGIATASELGFQATLIYILAYLFTNLGAFFTVLAIERNTNSSDLEAYNGLSLRAPLLSLALTIFLLSLAGIPPLVGFIAKIYIFSAAIKINSVVLAVAIALNSAVAAYYYFKVVKAMYLTAPSIPYGKFQNPLPIKIAVCTALIGTIAIGLFPAEMLHFAEQSLAALPLF
jgi:proton-translocating NADH-quinone oxidoreductase chain N